MEMTGYDKLLSFLSTLESEKPVPADLEEAAGEYAEKHGFRVPYDGSDNFYDDVDVKASKEGFIAGYNLCKEQMMKEAVEGVAHPEDCEIWVNLVGYGYKFKDGDKVSVIVIPNTDEK